MNTARRVIGTQTQFFLEGVAFTVPGAGNASATAKPGITDTGWSNPGAIKWTPENTSKTEVYMEASPGGYVATDEITLSKGMAYKGKIEKVSNLALQLLMSAAATGGGNLPTSPTAGGAYNPLAGSPTVKAWVHTQKYDQNNVLIDTCDVWASIKATGGMNHDDKAAELPVEVTVLFSTLNVGTLA